MRYLVLGAGGMAGHLITLYLLEQGEKVTGVARTALTFCNTVRIDVTDFDALAKLITSGSYDRIVNCVGILNECAQIHPDKAVLLNAYLPYFLQQKTKETDCRIIHISTDCIFSGKSGGYLEQSIPDAQHFYGRSKALGEINDDKNLTIRTSIVGPDINENGIGLFHWFMRQSGTIQGFEKAFWSGVTTLTLAKAVYQAGCHPITGLFHLVNNKKISKYELLCLFNQSMGRNLTILRTKDTVYDKSLINTRTDFDFDAGTYAEQIKEMTQWIDAHKELYPAYF